ncbi:MAG: NADH-ubiquinone oxidoreductase-F iron-sulfur binding region domain-containing protein [Dehalococcoidia bacterium]
MLIDEQGPVTSLTDYLDRGGGEGYIRARSMNPDDVIGMLRAAGLRGRGGAGFPTAIKWQGIRDSECERHFICCNAAEGEPGTFKDRFLIRHNPYRMLEGLAIAQHVLNAETAYVVTKASYAPEIERIERAYEEMKFATPMMDHVELVYGPDEYLFGEEKALVSVVDGGLPMPRVFPPYMQGLFSGAWAGPDERHNNPTVVNNVETLSHVANIVKNGPQWFRAEGTPTTPGTMIFCVSGDVKQPNVLELPLGVTLRELIYEHGGGPRGQRVKMVFPGVAGPLVTEAMLDTPLDFDALRNAGSGLGSGGFIVADNTACAVQAAYVFSHFLSIESCNQCTSCKLGSREITQRLRALLDGRARRDDVEEILDIASWVTGGHRCALPVSEQLVISAFIERFPDDFRAHLDGVCNLRHDMTIPKMKDYEPGRGFTYDEKYALKQPDWTYLKA